ncbi:hypothetical protein AB670_04173 [Chryseobacterium sp. MOF25P]|uniref:hypothetical protein n=1 Tax=unclassified Chryseobacterium TaxID=2593645 RepID=UPI000805547A|nr:MULTISPECIES: hypothetical protein [unclassified Chryseobacterium]OBW39511.1 hypothetical protein AB670_04173 [Chryseobacterium sp. MOF25P]OBW45390.1 hypothetical protein AB671_02511 [Chryseobacterium sp. BGARF1]
MIKQISSLAFCKSMILTLFLSVSSVFAQHNENTNNKREESVTLSYGLPFSYSLDTYTGWDIKNDAGDVLSSGSGNINEVFSKPGNYSVSIHEKHNHDSKSSCDHDQYPSKISVKVSPLKMVFDFSSIQFSKKIEGGQPAEGIMVTVNAVYSSYNNTSADYHHGFTTAGVGTSLSGRLNKDIVSLKNGVNKLEFSLEGSTTKGNNIMIEFKDINDQVQPYTLTEKN